MNEIRRTVGFIVHPAYFILHPRSILSFRVAVVIVLFLFPVFAHAHKGDEISLRVRLRHVGGVNVDGVLDGKSVYIPAFDVLNFIHVKADLSDDRTLISGFYIDKDKLYSIDFRTLTYTISGITHHLDSSEVIVTEMESYLRTDIFKRIFGFNCDFDYRKLEVEITSERDLPAVMEAKRQQSLSKNLVVSHQYGETFDRAFDMQRSIFGLGTLDWNLQEGISQNAPTPMTRTPIGYGLRLGGRIIGGDFYGQYTGQSGDTVSLRQAASNIAWRWRYGIVDSKLVSQISAGTISSFSSVGLSDSVLGIQITNRTNQARSGFSKYVINETTNPEWNVELYVNDNLVDYTKADVGGHFTFEIPLDYGTTQVKLKFYGPNGEIEYRDEEIRIPYTFLPPGRMEYTATAGTYRNDTHLHRGVAQGDVNIGVTNFLTVGGGSTIDRDKLDHPVLPFATMSLAPFGGILMAGRYQLGTGMQGDLSWGKNNFNIDFTYSHPMPFANPYLVSSSGDIRGMRLYTTLPFLMSSFNASITDQASVGRLGVETGTLGYAAYLGSIPFRLSLNAMLNRDGFHFIPSGALGEFGTALDILGMHFRPAISYDLISKHFIQAHSSITIPVARGLNLGLDAMYDIPTRTPSASLNFFWRTPFASFTTTGAYAQYAQSASIGAGGSLMFDGSTAEFAVSNTALVERAGVVIVPFLDQNNNGVRDPGEPLVTGVIVNPDGGQAIRESNGIVRVQGLDPYSSHIMKVSMRYVEVASMVPAFNSFKVSVGSNGFTSVDLPLTVGGQIAGNVVFRSQDSGATTNGFGGIRILLKRIGGTDTSVVKLKDDLITYSSGEFYYVGLQPGKYRAFVDPSQLEIKKFAASPAYIDIDLKNLPDGDEVDNLNFELHAMSHFPKGSH